MKPPTVSRLLDAWEHATSGPVWQRPIHLLMAAECDSGAAVALPLGERDAQLLRLREAVFGSQVRALANCPQCKERLELALNSSDFPGSGTGDADGPHSFQFEEFEGRFRLPNTGDVAAANNCETVEQGRRRIFERCVIVLQRKGKDTPVGEVSEEVMAAVAQRMAEVDPFADIELEITCPACGHQWEAAFDTGSFVYAELNAWAHKRLEEVHLLASAYGWSEAEILRLRPARRQFYLEAILG